MARYERDFQADSAGPLSVDELVQLLDAADRPKSRARQHAVACYLSGGDGWREAVKKLGGAFAEAAPELRDDKAD